ncbi:hypothetical protein C9374_013175 [Naegleria lovaniensis]|uniref:Uncharacterized protein n=1 Tax=Naegleria lovaniensis TaxID=51637 RepID=A0AA88GEY9_NAELO|nr:uncharacterized protein C9374_013175 [Naegleria lovaniensis]KAG2372811.1 hypothetical protein C9374_013175 [Naegleria lovaniensis]
MLGTDQEQSLTRPKLYDLDPDTLELVLSYCTGASEIESLKYSCRNLFLILSGGWDTLDSKVMTTHEENTITMMYSYKRIHEKMENLYLPRVYMHVAFGTVDDTQSMIDNDEEELENPSILLEQFMELFGVHNCKKIGEYEVEVVIDWEQSEALMVSLDNIYESTQHDSKDENVSQLNGEELKKEPINMQYYATTEEERQQLMRQHVTIKDRLKLWRNQYPAFINTKKMTVNPFRVFKKFILHINITGERESMRGIPRESIIRLTNRTYYYTFYKIMDPYIIDLRLGHVIEDWGQKFSFRKLNLWEDDSSVEAKLSNIPKICLYVFFYFRLIPIMEKYEIPLKSVYGHSEMNYLNGLLKQVDDIPKIYKYFTLHHNIICRYRRQVMNKKIALPPIKNSNYEKKAIGPLAMIEYFNLISFDTMNDKERIPFVRLALQHIYHSELLISDEWREKYFTQFGIGKDDAIQIERTCTENDQVLTFTFQTLEFDRTTAKMKHNIFTLPMYPHMSVSNMTHTRPSDKRLFHVTAGIGTLDKCCVEKCCAVPYLSPCNCYGICCCWCMTSCCCYKVNKSIGTALRSCGFPSWVASVADLCCCVNHRFLPALDLAFFFDVYSLINCSQPSSGQYFERYSKWEEYDHF